MKKRTPEKRTSDFLFWVLFDKSQSVFEDDKQSCPTAFTYDPHLWVRSIFDWAKKRGHSQAHAGENHPWFQSPKSPAQKPRWEVWGWPINTHQPPEETLPQCVPWTGEPCPQAVPLLWGSLAAVNAAKRTPLPCGRPPLPGAAKWLVAA